MAASPQYKIYDANGVYQAATEEIEAAACLMGFYGNGSQIRWLHTCILWTQGQDGDATNSYDNVADIAYRRVKAFQYGDHR